MEEIRIERWRRRYMAMEASQSNHETADSSEAVYEAYNENDFEAYNDNHTGGSQKKNSRQTSLTNLAALVIGVLFVVLSGAIFATTTWRIMPDPARVLTILGVAVLFFLVSFAAEKVFRIHKTANACYLLGCIFLFLTVMAAGYFGMLDEIFVQEKYRWWRILLMGSLLMETAMVLGIRRFSDSCYTTLCCIGVSFNVALFLEALGCSGQEFVSGMALYSSLLVVLHVLGADLFRSIRMGIGGQGGFAILHLCIFGWFLLLQCLWDGFANLLGTGFQPDVTTWLNIAGLAASAAASGLLAWKRDTVQGNGEGSGFIQTLAGLLCQVMAMELFHYCTFSLPLLGVDVDPDMVLLVPMILVTALFFMVPKWFSFLYSGLGAGLETMVLMWDSFFLALAAAFGFEKLRWQFSVILGILLLTAVLRAWGKRWEIVRMLLPLPLWYVVVPVYAILSQTVLPQVEPEWLCLAYGCGLMLWDFVRKDVFAPVIAMISTVSVCVTWNMGSRGMEVAWMAAAGLYVLGFAREQKYRKKALVGSMVLLTLAFLRQPWIIWPEVLRLEMFLLPLAADLFMLNYLWDDRTEVESLQTIGYVLCLAALTVDAFLGGKVVDALILEGICLVVFMASHLTGSRKWMWISGGILVAVVVYMTRDFWLSIAWWVYLLTAGIGLITFAAVREKRRDEEEKQD